MCIRDRYGSDVAGIIVSEHGQLVAEDLWNGYDAGAVSYTHLDVYKRQE